MRKIVIGLVAVVLGLALVALAVVGLKNANQRPAPEVSIELTEARLERGEYLSKHVLACMGCHSKRDWNRLGAPVVGHPGSGGNCFTEKWGFPGRVCPPNLTRDKLSGLGAWTDGEIMRAIREGVNRHGEALFPFMPYPAYRTLSDEDTRAVVAYLRRLKRRAHRGETTQLDFPVSFFIKFVPQPLEKAVPPPNKKDPRAYGQYLATVAGCKTCHTPTDAEKRPLAGKEFAGGYTFESPFGVVNSVNITFHETGLKGWSREDFLRRFRRFRDKKAAIEVKPGENTPMPWLEYAGITDEDLGMIYDYLKTVPPQNNRVPLRPAP
jgi:mono/diheme cytochrome c family protein